MQVKLGITDRTVTVFIPDPASTDGSGKTGLTHADLTVSYTRVETDNDVAVTDVTSSLSTLTALTDAHTDWGVKEVSSTLAPGLYRLDIADAVFASGAWEAVVYVMITSSAAAASPIKFQLVAFDPLDSVRLGLTALPNAAAEAAGGLYTRGTGAGQINQANNGNIDVNAVRFEGSTVAIGNVSTVFGTDFATNYDSTRVCWRSNIKAISDDTAAADNAEAFFDGTGYAGTGNVIPTVTTVTNQLTAAAIATGVWQDSTAGDFTAASSIGKALYISNIAPGDSGGHMISGSNAGTTTFGALTITGATTYTGNVSMAAGLTVAQSSLNSPAILVTGNGTAAGIDVTGGATGDGILVAAGGGSGRALHLGSITVDGTSVLTGAVSMGSTFTVTGGIVANITGNLSGSVGSVTGAVGSVTGAVGSVTGNVGGNVTGSIGSLATQAKADVNTEVLDVINVDTLIDGKTIKEAVIIIASTTAGRVSGAGTGTEVFKGLDEATTRVTVTVDSSGNRTDVVYG